MVMAWGRGEDGQLGHGDADDRTGPEAIHTLIRKGVTGVHCGAEYTVAVCRDRQEVYSWGWYAVRSLQFALADHSESKQLW